jgi:glycosyltransferase involved in cell wall biosynthesis
MMVLILSNDIEIVIVGDGAYMQKLKAKLKALSFIKFYEPVPYDELNNLLCSANVHFLFQKVAKKPFRLFFFFAVLPPVNWQT